MFKTLAFAAAIIGSVQADTLCATTADDLSSFVLESLTNDVDDYQIGDFYFNWCSPTMDGETNRYAYNNEAGINKNIATESFASTSETIMQTEADGTESVNGVILKQTGEVCELAAGDVAAINYQFISEITCNEDITDVVLAEENLVKSDSDCTYTVSFEHAAGCRVGDEVMDTIDDLSVTLEESLGWLYDNEWCIGIIYIIAGPIIALFGSMMFPYIVASLVALFIVGLICGLALAFGWMSSTGGSIAVLCVALIFGILAGCLVRRKPKILLGLLGLIAGFFSGSLVFALISGMSGWNAVWGYYVISVILAIVGCILSIKIGSKLVMGTTSMIGSYFFMRAWTLFFPGNYPSEAELMNSKSEDALEMSGIFWLFIAVFLVCWAGTLTFQCKHDKRHQDLIDEDDDFNKA